MDGEKKEEKHLARLESSLEEQTLGKWAESLGDTDTSAKYNKWPLLMAIQHFTSSPSSHYYPAGKPHARPFPIGLVSGDTTQARLSRWSAAGALDRRSEEDVFCLPFSGLWEEKTLEEINEVSLWEQRLRLMINEMNLRVHCISRHARELREL